MPFDWLRFVKMLYTLETTQPTRSLLGSTHRLYDNFEKWISHADAVWADFDMESASVKEILATDRRANETNGLEDNVALPFNVFLYVLPHGLQKLCELWCDDEATQIFNRLIAGLHTPTGEQNIAVWELSRKIKASPALMALMEKADSKEILDCLEESADGRQFNKDLAEFLASYGHRGANERDAYHFRWRQKPEMVFPSIKPLLALGDDESPAAFEAHLHERMLKTKAECLLKIRSQPLGSLKAAFFKWYLELTQDYFYYRDWERFSE